MKARLAGIWIASDTVEVHLRAKKTTTNRTPAKKTTRKAAKQELTAARRPRPRR